MTDRVQHADDSDVSSSYTPLPTRTKSGRSINKPVAFVPTIPEPSQSVKRRKSTKTLLAAKCKTCHRETEPTNNRIVFCDACSTAYHQYCHNPPIENEVVTVLEKEWLCTPCTRSKQSVVEGAQNLIAAESLSIDQVCIAKFRTCFIADDPRNVPTSHPSHRINSLDSYSRQPYDILSYPSSHQTSKI